jgi:FkbM family methyltransferase
MEEYWRGWQRLHPDWELRTWTEADLDWLRNRDVFDDAEHFSAKSNVVRYEVVLREGGVYVDTDFEALRPVDELVDGAEMVVAEELAGSYNCAFFAAAPGHPVLQRVVDELPASYWSQPGAKSPQRTGPAYFTRTVERARLDTGASVRTLPRDVVYPYNWQQEDPGRTGYARAFAVHHWDGSWSRREREPPLMARLRPYTTRVKRWSVRLRERWEHLPPETSRSRDLTWTATPIDSSSILVSTREGFAVVVDPTEVASAGPLLTSGEIDRPGAAVVDRYLRRGDTAVCVGAGTGHTAFRMARRVGYAGRVVVYEPRAAAVERLSYAAAVNRTLDVEAEVDIRPVAVGSAAGTSRLGWPVGRPDLARLSEQSLPEPEAGEHVEVVSLDEDLAAVAAIAVLRIEVSGDELDILQGAHALLRSGRVRVLDVALDDELIGDAWTALTDELRALVGATGARTSVPSRGHLRPAALDACLQQRTITHLVLELADRTSR